YHHTTTTPYHSTTSRRIVVPAHQSSMALHQDASWYQHIKVTCHDTKFPQQYVITSHHHTTTSMSSRDNSIP
ncbi:hypothetical protein HBP16_09440, partial [Staphylococcus aureus]|nr:hypothetical protein [Staphylococcus aureus]